MPVQLVMLIATAVLAVVAVVAAVIALRALREVRRLRTDDPIDMTGSTTALARRDEAAEPEPATVVDRVTDPEPAEVVEIVDGRVIVQPTREQVVAATMTRASVRLSILAAGLAHALRPESRDRITALMRREYRARRRARQRAARTAARRWVEP